MDNKTYKVGSDIYDIPEASVSDFLKSNPDAVETEGFIMGKDTFDIPINEKELFLKDNPTAQSIKKKLSSQDYLTSASGKEDIPFLGLSGKNPNASEEPLTPPSPLPSAKRTTTPMGDVLRSLKSGSMQALGGITGTPQFLNRTIAAFTTRPFLKHMGATDEQANAAIDAVTAGVPMGQIVLGGAKAQENLNKKAAKTEEKMFPIEGNIIKNLGEGNFGAAGELLARGASQSLPYLVETIATSGLGSAAVLATIGATAASQQYASTEGKPEGKRILNAWLYGGFEAAGELVTAGIAGGIGTAFRKGMSREAVDQMTKGAAKTIAKDFGLEFSSEAATQIGQNLTDIVTGVDPSRKLFDNVLDAGLIGGVSGGGLGIVHANAGVIGRAIAADKEVAQVQDNTQQQQVLIDQIETTDSDPVKSALEARLKTLKYEANTVMDANYHLAEQMSPEQQSKAAELYSVWNELQRKIDSGEVTEQEVPTIESTIEGIKEQIQTLKQEVASDIAKKEEKNVVEEKVKEGEEKPKPLTPEEIAKKNKLTYIGKQEGLEGDMGLDLYNVEVNDQTATFSVPQGSNEATVNAKQKDIVSKFPPETFKLGDKEFKSERELTDWLDKNYNEEDRFSSVNEEGYLEPNTMRVFNKWYEGNKKRLAEEDFSRREKEAEARQKEISTKPQIEGEDLYKTPNGNFTWDELVDKYEPDIKDIDSFYKIEEIPSKKIGRETIRGKVKITNARLGLLKEFPTKAKAQEWINGEGTQTFNDEVNKRKETYNQFKVGGQENAERIGEQIESTGQPTQGMVEGEESSLRVRDTSQDRVEAVKGEEIAESKENIPLEGEAVPTKPEEIPIEPPTVEEKPIVATQEIGEEVVPPEPPKPLEEVENAPKEGIHKIGLRAVESTILSDEIKQAVKEGGIDYAIRGKKVRTQEAEEIVKLYDEGGELGRLEEQVYNTDSDIPFDTRTSLNVSIAKHYVNKLNQSTDATERKEIIAKIRESIAFGQERATFYGQAVEAQKDWQEVLGTNPELSVHLKRARVEKEQAEMFKANEKEIDEGYKTFKDFLESEEIVKLIDEKVSEEISKIGTKRFGATDKKKIDDFFEGLKVKTEGKLFDATIAIPISIYNGSIEVIKRSILAGMDIANAVQAGMENLDKWHKEKYERGEITSPEWRKDDYKASLTEKLKPLVKSIKKIKISSIPKEKYKSLVDKMYAKMPMASKSQLRMLVKNALEELTATGEISKESFRNELAKALGKPHITDKQEMDLFNAGMAMKNVRQRGEEVNKAFDEYEKENAKTKPDKIKLKELKKKVDGTIREATKAIYLAQKAQKKTDEIFTDTPDWVDTYVTNIKGGLLTIPSLVVNLTSNIGSPLTRTPKNIIASSLDWMISGVARMYEPIIKKIDPEKSPWLYRQANKLPGSTRTTDFIGYLKGVRIGAGRGIIKGVRQVGTGALPEELLAREISRNLHPIDAAIRLVDMMKGKETASVGKYVQAILEAGPWSYNSEFMFRMLNVGDKPFKEAHYRARLSELANIKGLKGVERERFLEKPDEQSEADAKKTADIAVWQNDNAITKWLRDIERATKHDKGKKDLKTAIMQSTVVRTIARLGLATNAPYVKTPTNIIREGFEYAFPAYSLLRGAESAYNGNRRQALDFIGKAVVGTIIGSIASQLVSKKLISPPPSGDDKERAQQYEQDRPYMLNVSATMRAIEGKDYTPQADDLKVSIKPYGIFSAIMMSYVKAFSDVEPSKIEDMSYIDKMAKVVPAVVSSSLDQSFLAGTSVGLTAFIKGGPEMDKYLVSTSRALSSSLYPNNAAIISKTFFSDNFIRETKDLSVQDDHVQKQIQNDFKDRMFMGKELPAKVSIWGQKVNRIPDGRNWPYMLFDVTKYENNQESTFGTKIWQLYKDYKWINKEDATKLLPSLPSISTEVGWEDRKMTPQEVEEFQMEVGQRRASYVQHYVDSDQWEEDDVLTKGETLSKLYTKARREALANMFDWDETKTQYPEEWKDTYDLGIIPLPSINRKFANTTLSQEDVAIFNRMAADNYVQEISKKKKILESKTEEERQLIANAIWKVYLGKAKVAVWKQNKGKQSR